MKIEHGFDAAKHKNLQNMIKFRETLKVTVCRPVDVYQI